MTLGPALQTGRIATLDALRLLLAAGVIVSHAWPLALGPGTSEPLEGGTGHSLGRWCVGLFFFLSGMLIAASAERKGAKAFWTARALRLLPGLSVALVFTGVVALACGATPAPAELAAWYLRALSLFSIEHRLTGAFAQNPYPEVVNGPLWSLSHEVLAYLLCFCAAHLARRFGHAAWLSLLALAVAVIASHLGLPGRAGTFAPLFGCFAFGMVVHALRDWLPTDAVLAPVLILLAGVMPWPLAVGALGYAALILVFRLPAFRLGADLSYGLYIYGWPVAQALVHLQPGIAPVPLAVLSLLAACPLAWLSWNLVERPRALRAAAAV